MPNFVAKIRTSYQDMEGLVLDCRQEGLETDGSEWENVAPPARPIYTGTHTGANNAAILTDSAANWRTDELVGRTVYNLTDGSLATITGNNENQISGVLAGGVDNDWDTSDVYRVATPRFGNPYQDTPANRPTVSTVGGYQQALFVRANSEYFNLPLVDAIATTYWMAAFEYLTVAAAGNDHPVLYFPNWSIWRRNAAGNYKYRHGAVDVNGVGDMTAGTWAMWYTGAAAGELDRNGVLSLAGSHSAQAIAAGDPAGYIAGNPPSVQYCDIILRSMQIWSRIASPLEVDFAFQTLSCEFDYEQLGRADIATDVWTDDTGTASTEISRINATHLVPQRFFKGQYPTGGAGRVQIAAAVDGIVLPDTLLGGDLFDIKCVEYPSAGHPAVYQDAGWSSVWDVRIDTEGHYTFVVYRDGSGSQVLHLDMEAV